MLGTSSKYAPKGWNKIDLQFGKNKKTPTQQLNKFAKIPQRYIASNQPPLMDSTTHPPRTVTVVVHAKDLAAACSRRQEAKPRGFWDNDIADIPSMGLVYLPRFGGF